jgi:hypothetical protein
LRLRDPSSLRRLRAGLTTIHLHAELAAGAPSRRGRVFDIVRLKENWKGARLRPGGVSARTP